VIKEFITLIMLFASLLITQASTEHGSPSNTSSAVKQLLNGVNSYTVITITSAGVVPAQRAFIDFGEVYVGSSARGGVDFSCQADSCWLTAIVKYPSPPFYWKGCLPPVGGRVSRGGQISCDIEFRPDYADTFTDIAIVQYCRETEEIERPPPEQLTCAEAHVVMRGRGIPLPNVPPVAVCRFSPSNPTTAIDIQFSSSGSYDPDGWITSYSWDFGDGSSSTLPNPTHKYARAGSYTVRLSVWDNKGMASSPAICIVNVAPAPFPQFDPIKVAAAGGGGLLAGVLTYNMLSQPPAPPPMAPGFAPAILPATIAVVAGLYLFPADQLIVRLPKGISQKQAQRLIRQIVPASEIIGFFSPINAYLVRFRDVDRITQMEDKVKELERIETELRRRLPKGSSVLKNYLGRLEGQPSDISKLPEDLRKAYDIVFAKPAWDRLSLTKLHPVRVAIIDSGLDVTHLEFKGVKTQGESYVKKHDKELDSWQEDPIGHGTAVSGIIGAQNGLGRMNGLVSAVHTDYQIQMYKVAVDPAKVIVPPDQMPTHSTTTAPLFSVLDAIRLGISEAKRRGAVVINISIGWDRYRVQTEQDIIEIHNIFKETMLQYPNILFVTSAGNGDKEDLSTSQGQDVKHIMHAPGGVATDNNITVAAADAQGTGLASFSNYGLGVDIAAPGVDVFTTDKGGSYALVSGTSFSAAMVSGTAALLLSIEPHLSPKEVREILQAAATRRLASPEGAIRLLEIDKAVRETLERKARKDSQRLLLAAGVGIAVAAVIWLNLK